MRSAGGSASSAARSNSASRDRIQSSNEAPALAGGAPATALMGLSSRCARSIRAWGGPARSCAAQLSRIERSQHVAVELADLLLGHRQLALAVPGQFGAAAVRGNRAVEAQFTCLHAPDQRVEFVERL